MLRYRLLPSPAQKVVLRDHCTHAERVRTSRPGSSPGGGPDAPARPATWSSAA